MRICLNDSFVSIVQSKTDRDVLVVRSGIKGDLEAFFRDSDVEPKITKTPKLDYLFRCEATYERVGRALLQNLLRVNYSNFKDSVTRSRPSQRLSGLLDDHEPSTAQARNGPPARRPVQQCCRCAKCSTINP
jgi:hypothetical protein